MALPTVKNKDITKYSQPYFYKYNKFGDKDKGLHSFSIELSVKQLETDFIIFQEIKEIEHWPISQLIQRELDINRSNQIAKSYLLQNEERLKMFPPLTVALIPVDNEGKPLREYGDGIVDNEIIETIRNRYEIGKDFEWEKKSSLNGLLNFTHKESDIFGNIIWDKSKIHAVVIDGQHRMKALLKASIEEKSIYDWLLSINIIDLHKYISIRDNYIESKDVVYYVRDIFMDMNNTSVAVDLSKRILINNNNPICLITQDLVEEGDFDWNESDYSKFNFIPPQLIDWNCKGGKHELKKMTGIITLSQVIEFAFFDSKDIDKIKNTKKNIKNWRDLIESTFSIEKILVTDGKISFNEYIESYYSDIVDEDEEDADESSEILFQYDNEINLLIRDQFNNFYKTSFLAVYSSMSPFAKNYTIAKELNLFNNKDNIFRFSRMTDKKLKSLSELDNIEKVSKTKLEKEFNPKISELSENNFILISVMGQKAIMRFIFKHFMAINDDRQSDDKILNSTKIIISKFNKFYDFLQSTPKYKSFFQLSHVMNHKGEIVLEQNFWEGIISKNNTIIYNKSGMDSLIYILEFIFDIKEEKENKAIIKRIEGILKGLYGKEYSKATEESIRINKAKIDYLIKLRKDFKVA
ncbi:MAG: hypothetical protein JJT78_12690 [Leptospira sp.]|nr:hypothetical protein [Leptospira sp.]